jgi:nitroreductase/NAD-dependent dihydropyrimidine dehydrogenase PreA subunit
MSKISIDLNVCKRDGRCVEECPAVVFERREKGRVPEVAHEEYCIACGHCVAICPHGALAHTEFPSGSVHPLRQEMIPSGEQALELLRSRRSTRAFKDRPVERELIEKVIEAARLAPSAHNTQSTEFIVIQELAVMQEISRLTADYLEKITKLLRNPLSRAFLRLVEGEKVKGAMRALDGFERVVRAVREGKDRILRHAPVLILFHADRRTVFAEANANLALQNATLVAQALSLGSFWTGYVVSTCDRDMHIPRLLSLPEEHKVYGGLALGYPRFQFGNWMEKRPARVAWM